MSFRDDRRAQSIQIGAVLLFGVLIILLATYQAFIVPDQNREVEAEHVERITGQMQDLRNAIVSIPSTNAGRSVTLTLGTSYPPRVVAVNPGPPTGAIRTVGTTNESVNFTVANAVATADEVDDVWNGTNRTYNTGGMVFQPGYNEFRNAPTVVYENTLLYHRFRTGNLTRSGQRLVDGRRLTLVTLNGSLDTSASESVAVDLDAASASSRRISVTNATDENVTLSFASGLNASRWEDELRADGEFADQDGHVVEVTDDPLPGVPFRLVHVELEGNVTYTLHMAKVGTGTGVADEDVTYLADVEGDGVSIQEGSTTRLVLEARDGLNNPVPGVTVNGSIESAPENGRLEEDAVETDSDGRAVFEYVADEIDGVASRQFAINFSYEAPPGTDFDAQAPENATMNVTVQNTDASGFGGSSATSLSWFSPTADNSGGVSDCSSDECTFNVSEHGDTDLTLRVDTDPTFPNLDVEFGVNNSTVGTVSPTLNTTDSDGESTTEFTAAENGTVDVVAGSGVGSDILTLHVEGIGGGGGNNAPVASIDDIEDNSTECTRNPGGNCVGGSTHTTNFTVDYSASDVDADLTDLQVELIDPDGNVVDSASHTYGGVSSASETDTLTHDHTDHWNEEFTVRVTATDDNGNTDVVTQTEIADGN